MLDKNGIIKRLTIANTLSKREVSVLKDLQNASPLDYFDHIYKYVIYKFLLDDDDNISDTHNLNELAQLSVAKAAKLNPNEVVLLDVSKHCGSTTSYMTKKILLFMSLSDEFDFKYPPYNTADIETTDELANIIYEKTRPKK